MQDKVTYILDDGDNINLAAVFAGMKKSIRIAVQDYYIEHGKLPTVYALTANIPVPLADIVLPLAQEFGIAGFVKSFEKDGNTVVKTVFAYIGPEEECKTFTQKINGIIKAEYPSYGCKYMEIPL